MKPNPLMQRIGWGAGVLLIVLIVIAIIPPLVVKYQTSAFTGGLRTGMSASDVRNEAASMHLSVNGDRVGFLIVGIREPWTFGSNCSNDEVVVVTLTGERVERWHQIGERVCMKG